MRTGAFRELCSGAETPELRGDLREKLKGKFRWEIYMRVTAQEAALQTCEIIGKMKTFSNT